MPAAGKGGGRRQALRRRDRSLCPGGSQSDGQTGPQGGTTISDGARVLEGRAEAGRITGEPGAGAGVLYFKKEGDE